MRRIKRADIKFLSLCAAGKNKLPVIYKAEDDSFELAMLSKGNMDLGEITSCVYAPELRDSEGDIASAEVIKDMAYRAMQNGLNVDIHHDGKALAKSQAHVAESFIIQKGDPRFTDMKDRNGKAVDVTGGWGTVIKVLDSDLRAKYRSGEWTGISMGGTGDLRMEKARTKKKNSKELLHAFMEHLGLVGARAHHHVTLSGEVPMEKAELDKTLETFQNNITKALTTSVAEMIAKAGDAQLEGAAGCLATDTPEVKAARITLFKASGKPATATTPATPAAIKKAEAPVFKGDPTDKAAMDAHIFELQKYDITKNVDWTDIAQVRKAQTELAALTPAGDTSAEETAAGVVKGDSDDVKRLKIQLAKAQRGSNQAQTPAAGPYPFSGTTLSKADKAELDEGDAMATYINGGNKEAVGK